MERVVDGPTDDGLFDCLLVDGRVAVEAQEPSSFLGRDPDGQTRLRKRLLEARGLRVVAVPFFYWDALESDRDKATYLARAFPADSGDSQARPPSTDADRT